MGLNVWDNDFTGDLDSCRTVVCWASHTEQQPILVFSFLISLRADNYHYVIHDNTFLQESRECRRFGQLRNNVLLSTVPADQFDT